MASMLLRVSDENLVPDLAGHFARANFEVVEAGGSMIMVAHVEAEGDVAERREIAAHLRIWQAAHPGANVEIVP